MDPVKVDRRVGRTRRMLREALMTLILEKGYDGVTVEDITNRADLGRTTFYLHYRDKEDLLLESLEAIADDLKRQIEDQGDAVSIYPRPVELAFRHAAEHRDLYRIILKGEGASRAASRIRDIISDTAIDFFKRRVIEQVADRPLVPMEVTAAYFASALLGFMTWWLEKEAPYPASAAAEMFSALFFGGARQVLGLHTGEQEVRGD